VAEDELVGRLLLATPGLPDGNFARSVVLVLAHGPAGALGLVLDRPGALPVAEVLPQWAERVAPPSVVFVGGPVEPSTAICLGSTADGWQPIDTNDDPSNAKWRQIRVFGGYAGWSAGQLENEIEAGGWYVLVGLPGDPFTDDPASLYRRVLRRQQNRLALASTAPLDVRQN
jgi:putative transcriptional regulator